MTPPPRGDHEFWGPDSMQQAYDAATSGQTYHPVPPPPPPQPVEFHKIPPPPPPPPVKFHKIPPPPPPQPVKFHKVPPPPPPQPVQFHKLPTGPPALTTGRQLAVTPAQRETVIASAVFRIWTIEGSADFAELGGINSEIEQTEYMEAGPVGALFSRHPGRSKPPTVTLKRALRTGLSTTWLWSWHQLARASLPGMHRDCSLTLFGPGDDTSGSGRMTYMLMNAFPSKVEIAGVKAGASEVILQTVTLQCDDLIDPNVI